jgi:DNA-binding MarR family transcriptional regulator
MSNLTPEQDSRALRLAVAVKRLRARMQDAAPADAIGLSLSQLSILRRLRLEGSMTAAALAAAEHVTHQAITQVINGLKREGLVEAAPDPADGRKWLLSITAEGNRLFDAVNASRTAWLADAIEFTVAEDELPALDKAIELLERLAAVAHSETD